MHKLVWALMICKQQSQGFSSRVSYDVEAKTYYYAGFYDA